MKPKYGEHYKHSKSGKLYQVLGIAKHSETLEDLVLYGALYKNEVSKLWVRPLNMFFEQVEIKGEMRPRFERVLPPEYITISQHEFELDPGKYVERGGVHITDDSGKMIMTIAGGMPQFNLETASWLTDDE